MSYELEKNTLYLLPVIIGLLVILAFPYKEAAADWMSNCDIPIENSCAVSSFDIVDTVGYRGSVNYIVSNISKYNGLIFVRFSDVDENYRPWKIIVDGKKYRHNDDRLLTALKRGNMAEFHVVNPKSKEQRVVEYSLIGFTAAYRKAQKSH